MQTNRQELINGLIKAEEQENESLIAYYIRAIKNDNDNIHNLIKDK